MDKNKKAVSPLIATVLLITLVITLSVIVYAWSKSFVSEQLEKFGDPIETICQTIKFDAQLSQKGNLYELFINNQANVDMHQIYIKFHVGGRSIVRTFPPDDGSIGKGGTGKVSLTFSKLEEEFEVSSFDSIDVAPVLLGKGSGTGKTKLHPCLEKTKEGIKLS